MLRLHTLLCASQGALLHAILVDGMIEKIEGRPELAEAAVCRQRKAGHLSEYLFAAKSEQEFERKRKVSPQLSAFRPTERSHCEQHYCRKPQS